MKRIEKNFRNSMPVTNSVTKQAVALQSVINLVAFRPNTLLLPPNPAETVVSKFAKMGLIIRVTKTVQN